MSKFRVKGFNTTPVRLAAEHQSSSSFPPTPNAYDYPSPQLSFPPDRIPASAPYYSQLPQGIVNDEIVASLERYPAFEQQAWARSLPPPAMHMYRQIMADRVAAPYKTAPVPPPIAYPPSSGRSNGVATFPDRQAPPLPTIKCIEISLTSAASDPEYRPVFRLHNMRGVVTHAVVVDAETSEIEVTAFLADTAVGEGVDDSMEAPEVSLRMNGNQSSQPKPVYRGNLVNRPSGTRWTVSFPTSRVETKIEVVATKPGAVAETSTIFFNRQY